MRKRRILTLALLPLAMCTGEWCAAQKQGDQAAAHASQQTPTAIKEAVSPVRGTKELPQVVELAPSPFARVATMDVTQRQVDHLSPEWLLAYFTCGLMVVTAGLALYTFRLYRATVALGRQAQLTATEQTDRMERSVREAARAATAMESVAAVTGANANLMQTLMRKQMRAYLSVEIGTATYQDENCLFQAHPRLTNNGLTPARNVRYKALTDIIDGSGPEEVVLADVGEIPKSDVGIAPRQTFTMGAPCVDRRVSDAAVAGIMDGFTKRLYVWGKVIYDDVYDGTWETNFCINYTFHKNLEGQIIPNGFFYQRHNDAT